MQDNDFDNELTRLYQQRKSSIVVPPFTEQVPKRNRWLKPIATLTIGGGLSLATVAVMTVLIKPAPQVENVQPSVPQDNVVTMIEPPAVKTPVSPLPAQLPQQPEVTQLPEQATETIEQLPAIAPERIQMGVNQALSIHLPDLAVPKAERVPVHRVLPQFDAYQQPGAVTLRYQIDEQGKVFDVKVVEATLNYQGQKKAKKALTQWRYEKSQATEKPLEIIFEFSHN